MKTLNKKTFTLNGTEWELLNNITGELPLESDEKLLERVIKVDEFYEDDSKEPNDSFFGTENTFVRDFRGNGKLFRMLLTPQEIALLTFLTDYISYNDCILRTNGNRKGNILSVEDLAKEYGMNYDAFRKLMTKLRKKQIIDYHDKNTLSTTVGIIQQRCITFNPYVKCRGKKIDNYVIEHYSSTLWASVNRQKTSEYRKSRQSKENKLNDC